MSDYLEVFREVPSEGDCLLYVHTYTYSMSPGINAKYILGLGVFYSRDMGILLAWARDIVGIVSS